ncbi:unnamed protein product [Mytilus coruscus]|uniref:Uncharacterized protein n=1 Tax=Mytilus coruscus TaxID=42192 RepID=A0A6J8CRN6_MYTCO|nr:unnamed protein product [Mytilus coruscus]
MVNDASTTTECVGKLTNCMTDRSATELKSNKLLSELKTEELPNDSDFNEFQCSVHPLLQFADEVEKVAKEIEKKYDVKFKNLFRNKGESYSHNLIRCVSKLFHSDKTKNHFTQHKFDDNKCKVDAEKQQDNGMARGKNEEDKSIIMAQARKDAEILKEKSIAEDIKIEQERRETLKERIEEKEAKLKKSEQHLKDSLQYKKDKLNALKTQILFRIDVEKQVCDKTLFRRNLDIQLQKKLINLMEEENKITNLEDAIVPMEVDEDINLSGISTNHDNPSSPLPASSTVISNPDPSPSIPEPSTANNSRSPSSSFVPKHNQSASASVPTQHDLISKPPCWFNKKYITHTWDEGSKLTTYHGKIQVTFPVDHIKQCTIIN